MAASRKPSTHRPRIAPLPRDVLTALDAPPLYARVDMVRGAGGELLLMELEVIEPFLFPKDGPQIGAMLGAALARKLTLTPDLADRQAPAWLSRRHATVDVEAVTWRPRSGPRIGSNTHSS